ncbi:MAG: chloride channel protein [Methylovirgula sp.]
MTLNHRYIHHAHSLSRIVLRRWRRRIFFLMGGLMVGGAAIIMALLADKAQELWLHILSYSHYIALVLTPLGFGLALFLARRYFPNSQGSGIPQVIAARQLPDVESRLSLVSLWIAFGKILVMMLGLLVGASIGREGPTVQVGAALMFAVGRRTLHYQRGLLLAGAAAGIAAAFNTPLAGIVFGIEELSRSFESRTSGLVIAAVIAAGLTSLGVFGDYSYFGSTPAVLPLGGSWVVVPVCAVIAGFAGGLFSRILILFTAGLPGRVGGWISRHPVAFAMLCGLAVAICGIASGDSVYGTGYAQAREIVHGHALDSGIFGPLKFLASVFSAISGIPGGIFAPSLAVGAGIAADLHLIFRNVPLGALALLGMVSYLAGAVQTPITSFVIVSEMTENHGMIIPLMIAALIADATSKLICRGSLYHSLAEITLHNMAARHAGKPPVP